MAKRFTLTEKWEDTWFFALKPKYKLLWLFILDKCDHAGVYEANLELARKYLGVKYEEEDALTVLAGKVRKIGASKWMIEKFILHQYGCEMQNLNPNNSAHKGVITALLRHGIDPTKPLDSPYEAPIGGAMDKDKDKEKDQDKKKKLYAEFVSMTEGEHEKLVEELGEARTAQAIEILDNYKGSKGKRYASDYRAIRSWVIGELEKRERTGKTGDGQRIRGRIVTEQDILNDALRNTRSGN